MTPTPTSPDQPQPPARSRHWLWATLGVTVLLGLGIGGWYYSRPQPPAPLVPPNLPVTDGADPEVVRVVEEIRQQVLKTPRSAAAWGTLGMVFGAHGFETEADVCFTEAGRLDATDPRWPYFRGLFAVVHQPTTALAHLERALALGGTDPEARSAIALRLAELWFDLGDWDNAETHFRAELGPVPGHPRAQLGLGQIAMSKGDRAAAQTAFGAATSSPFAHKRASIQLAALARASGELTTAARYEETARKAPNDLPWPDPYLTQLRKHEVGQQGRLREVETLEAAGQIAQANQRLRALVQADPSPKILVATGINLAKVRDYPQAERMFRECLRQEPHFTQAHFFLAVVLFERAALTGTAQAEALRNEAIEHARQVVAVKPDHGLAWLYLGRLYLAQGKPKEAVEPLQQALNCRPEFVDTHLYLAEALAASDQPDAARVHARNAAKLAEANDPRPRELLQRLGLKE